MTYPQGAPTIMAADDITDTEQGRVHRQDAGASPATVLRSGAGEVRLSEDTATALAAGHTITLEEYRAAQADVAERGSDRG